jgi:hypothetical protein
VKGVRATWFLAGVVAAAIGVAAPASGQTTPNVAAVRVPVTAAFTNSGLTVKTGDKITIKAAGKIQFQGGGAKTKRTTGPEGIPVSDQCRRIASQVSKAPFPEPQFACYSLIGKVGATGKPFEVGAKKTFTVPATGILYLGINDNYVGDNTGTWYAAVSGATGKGNVLAPPKTSPKTRSSLMPIILMVGGVLLAVLLIAWVVSRRRKPAAKPVAAAPKKKPLSKPKPNTAPETAAAAAAAAALRRTEEERAATAPIDPDSADVNIFKVELLDPTSFQVGYNFFPEGTAVHWRVADNGAALATGEFVTEGGGSRQHYETVPLGTTIADPREVEVSFTWAIREVPFSYAVRRSWSH